MKITYVLISIFTIVLVLLSGIPLMSGGATNYANAKYANTQTQANANECDEGTTCAINSPQTQGDGSVSSPTNLQISETNEEASTTLPPTSGPGAHTSLVQITTFVSCPSGFVCLQDNDFQYDITIDGSQCSVEDRPIHCLFSATPESFSGGLTTVTFNILNFGTFVLTVTLPPTPPGLTLQQPLDLNCIPSGVLTQTGPASFSGVIQEDTFSGCSIDYVYSQL
jgi:hypothetical protein